MAEVAPGDAAEKPIESINKEANEKFKKSDDPDACLTKGPLKKRNCTDIICLIVYFLHWGVYAVVTFMGVQDGNPWKLVRPRDYRGDYCGVETQWNNPDAALKDSQMLTYTMNVSATVEMIAKQLICSSLAEDQLESIWGATSTDLADYRCACCKSACRVCYGSLQMTDIKEASAIAGQIGSKLGELTDPSKVTSLFSANGANGDVFANMWDAATQYFVKTCSWGCESVKQPTARTYVYTPSNDESWKKAWDTLATHPNVSQEVKDTIANDFTFNALSEKDCPYPVRYCVPFPGLEFVELPNDHCMFQISGTLSGIVTDAASTALQGGTQLAESASQSIGDAVGVILLTIDVFLIVSVFAFVVGIVFLVLLRFLVGFVVWFALFLVFVFLGGGGVAAYVRSGQCAGTSMASTAQAGAVSQATYVQTAAQNAMSGQETLSEAMTGWGEDYRGAQTRTRSGRLCQRWDAQEPHEHTTTPENYPDAGLVENYCRNPEEAPGIWCFTTDTDKRWELCQPIGVFLPECPAGYEVEDESMREVLKIFAYILWGLAGVWLVIVFCLRNRIRLAIAVNQVAADFIVETPTVIFVPLVQIFFAVSWALLWAFSVTFLLSQVPDGYTPKDSYATYAEAYGTSDTPGKCTDKWPTGFVWKDEENCDNTGEEPKCWKCAPPRYVLDVRFFISFFSYLWNNALLIALGQCIIAGAVGFWFFTPRNKSKAQGSNLGFVVKTSTWMVFRYHVGSLAFGAFIIAAVQFARYVMKYFEKQAQAQKNKLAALILKIVQWILWCFEKCIKFLNKNAYIQIALVGKNFCSSAKAAFYLILRNAIRFGTVALLGGVIHFIGFMFITIATTAIAWIVLTSIHPEVAPIIPMMLYAGVGYIAANLYMNVFQLSVDTALQCFIIVEEMGDEADLDFVPKPLKSLVPKKGGGWFPF